MIILGVDCGFATTGWSIVEKDVTSRNGFKLIDFGSIQTNSKMDFSDRLGVLYEGITDIITRHKPDEVALESLFYFKNQKTVINVGQARGVILLAAKHKNVKVTNYNPLQVKISVTGYGRAEKKQVQKMIQMIFGLKEIPKPDDAADAIAIAVCHLNSLRIKSKNKKMM